MKYWRRDCWFESPLMFHCSCLQKADQSRLSGILLFQESAWTEIEEHGKLETEREKKGQLGLDISLSHVQLVSLAQSSMSQRDSRWASGRPGRYIPGCNDSNDWCWSKIMFYFGDLCLEIDQWSEDSRHLSFNEKSWTSLFVSFVNWLTIKAAESKGILHESIALLWRCNAVLLKRNKLPWQHWNLNKHGELHVATHRTDNIHHETSLPPRNPI